MRFFDRESEISVLNALYEKAGASMVNVYGRRRVGKSRLLREFTSNKPSIYYTASTLVENQQVSRFTQTMNEFFKPAAPPGRFDTWVEALEYLMNKACEYEHRFIVVLDEFSYIEDQNPHVPSFLNSIWEDVGANSNIMLILCGSLISQMKKLNAGRQPLFARFSGSISLRPFSFREASMFLEHWVFERRVEAYSVLGGMPLYLEMASGYEDVYQVITSEITSPYSILYEEIPFLLSQELREPATYMAILALISRGHTRLGQISASLGKSSSSISSYLSRLEEMELVGREVSITEKSPEKSRRNYYYIKDNFIRFWFRFLFPNRHLIENGDHKAAVDLIERGFSSYLGLCVEEIVREAIRLENNRNNLPLQLQKVGKYLSKSNEIDICCPSLDGSSWLFGECKWKNHPVGPQVLESLKSKAQATGLTGEKPNHYLICSKSGFDDGLEALCREDHSIILWSSEDLEQVFST